MGLRGTYSKVTRFLSSPGCDGVQGGRLAQQGVPIFRAGWGGNSGLLPHLFSSSVIKKRTGGASHEDKGRSSPGPQHCTHWTSQFVICLCTTSSYFRCQSHPTGASTPWADPKPVGLVGVSSLHHTSGPNLGWQNPGALFSALDSPSLLEEVVGGGGGRLRYIYCFLLSSVETMQRNRPSL